MTVVEREIAPDLVDRLRARFEGRPTQKFLGFDIELLEIDHCRLRMPFQPQHDNGGGAIHGGILAMLADTAIACALSTNFDGKMGFATSNLTMHYLRRARTDVVADAEIVKKGRTICVGHVRIFDRDDRLVATSTCDFVLTTSRLEHRP